MDNTQKSASVLNKNFILLIFGHSTSKMGNIIYNSLLALWLVQNTGNTKFFGYITAAGMLPIFLFNLFSGVLVDNFNKKKILILTDILSSLTCIVVSFMVFNNIINIPILIIASFLLGTCSSLFDPAAKSIVKDLINKNNLIRANSIFNTVLQIISVASPLIASILCGILGLNLAYIFLYNGVTFFISAISEFYINYTNIQSSPVKLSKDLVIKDILDGLYYIKSTKWLFQLLLVIAFVNFFLSGYNIILPLFFNNNFYNGESLYFTAISCEALFGILGGVSLSLKNSNNTNLKKELFLCGISILFIQLFKLKYLVLFFIGLYGFFLSRFNILFFSYIQNNVDENKLGRVLSIIFMIALGLMPFGNLIFGFLGSSIINFTYIVFGLGIILSTLLIKTNLLNSQ